MSFPPDGEPPVIVCGAGAAGMAAAIASARQGLPTVLVESHPDTGGTVARSLLHTLGGLFDSRGELLNNGLPAELIVRLQQADPRVTPRAMGKLWVLNVDPAVYRQVTRDWLAEEPNLQLLTGSRVVEVDAGPDILRQVTLRTPAGRLTLSPRAAIDATGGGKLVELLDPAAIEDDERRAAGGLIVRLRGVPPGTLAFPRGVGFVRSLRAAALRGELSASCQHAWLDAGIEPDEIYLKLFVPMEGWRGSQPVQEQGGSPYDVAQDVVNWLRRLPEFAGATVEETGEIGVRDGGRIRGDYRLTVEDVRSGRRFPDAACRAAWPIEYWHPAAGIQLESLPTDLMYEIPLSALRLRGWRNVWMAGKCLSADHLAQASARVAGTCWAMGEAVGIAAACRTEAIRHES